MRDELADNEIVWLDDPEESQIASIWQLSLKSGLSALECEYQVIKDACQSHQLDGIEVYQVCKQMASKLSSKKS